MSSPVRTSGPAPRPLSAPPGGVSRSSTKEPRPPAADQIIVAPRSRFSEDVPVLDGRKVVTPEGATEELLVALTHLPAAELDEGLRAAVAELGIAAVERGLGALARQKATQERRLRALEADAGASRSAGIDPSAEIGPARAHLKAFGQALERLQAGLPELRGAAQRAEADFLKAVPKAVDTLLDASAKTAREAQADASRPARMTALSAAAQTLQKMDAEISRVRSAEARAMRFVSMPHGMDRTVPTPESEALGAKARQLEASRAAVLARLSGQHPILAHVGRPGARSSLAKVAKGGTVAAGEVRRAAQEVLDNIESTRAKLHAEPEKALHLAPVRAAVTDALGWAPSGFEARAVGDAAAQAARSEALGEAAYATLALGASVAAGIFLTPLAGAAVGVALGAPQVASEVQTYRFESAAAHTDFDRAQALAQEDPELLWLALDIAALGLDVFAAAKAFKALAPLAKAALAAPEADLVRLLPQLKAAAPDAKTGQALADEIRRLRGDTDLMSKARPAPTVRAGERAGGLAGRLIREDGRISGPRFAGAYRSEQLEAAERLGIEVQENADALLDSVNPNAAAAFDRSRGIIYVREGATRAEWFHEFAHARQWQQLGRKAYEEQGTWGRELHVFQEIMKNTELHNFYQVEAAKNYIRRLAQRLGQAVPPEAW